MKITETQKKELEQIEKKVCDFFEITTQEIINYTKKHTPCIARSYVLYIAHYDMKLSISCLCNIYARKPRGILKSISKIKYLIENQRKYNNIYKEVTNKKVPRE